MLVLQKGKMNKGKVSPQDSVFFCNKNCAYQKSKLGYIAHMGKIAPIPDIHGNCVSVL